MHALFASGWQLVLSPVPEAPVQAPDGHCPWLTHLPLLHWASAVHQHAVAAGLHVPMAHAYVVAPALHDVGWQVPAVAPTHVYVESWQSADVAHGSLHDPATPLTPPLQTWPKPHCDTSWHGPVPLPTRAEAETWKSLKTTRPH